MFRRLSVIFLFGFIINILLENSELTANEAPREIDPAKVIVLANSSNPDSIRIAKHFMSARSIPDRNLVALEMSNSGRIGRDHYNNAILNPFIESLVEKEFVSAIPGKKDPFGRLTTLLFQSKVEYVVTCYGVPFHIVGGGNTDDFSLQRAFFKLNSRAAVPFANGNLRTTSSSVDSDLSVAFVQNAPLNGHIPNPFFRSSQEPKLGFLKVMRLDGPDPQSIIELIDRTIRAEQNGLKGRAYADEDSRGGAYKRGNDWIRRSAEIFSQLGYDLAHNTDRAIFNYGDRMDAPALYAGWYSGAFKGPMALEGFRFPEGAIAVHLHSYSGNDIRSTNKGWVGPFIDRGVSATVGNTAEPYLELTHHYDLIFKALANDWPLADAIYHSIPSLSWNNLAIGDPFYRPFQAELKEELQTALNNPYDPLSPYVALRVYNQLLNADEKEKGDDLLNNWIKTINSPAILLKLAQEQFDRNKPKRARRILESIAQQFPRDSSEIGLYLQIADLYMKVKGAESALSIYQHVLAASQLPKGLNKEILSKAIAAAEKSKNKKIAEALKRKLEELTNPVPEELTNPVPEN